MKASSRSTLWWGLVLGLVLALAALGGLYLAGYRLMRHLPEDSATSSRERKPLCYVSPTDPGFVRLEPGKDEKGQDLLPVYPTQPGASPSGRTVTFWRSPTDPTYIRDKPGKDPQGQELVPFTGELAQAPATDGKKERKVKYWVSPMDPGYVRDQPGKAPCGMDLVPVYEDEPGAAQEGAIAVDPQVLQSMGVRTAKAEVRELSRTIRAVGKVTYDERRLTVVNTKLSGWVERLYVKATGDPIRKGQNLLDLYSPELVTTQEEYLLAWRNFNSLKKSGLPEYQEGARRLLAAACQRLKYWDIPDSQIAALERTGEVKKTLTLVSPTNGIVIKRMVTQGQMVQAGMPLLEVADLSTVWVEADIYEYELPWVKVGQHAHLTLTYLPGETFHGQVQYIYPYLKEATRTARVRLAVPNPGLRLKPEMFAQVDIISPVKGASVAVPQEAVLDTGERQHVFVALGGGRFAPREVKLGVRSNDGLVQILSGLNGGEEVVTSAQFLLDSESRFREAIGQMLKGREAKPAPTEGAPPPAAPAAPAMPPGHRH
jgi:Cu(I)/Ag(I) efflux system membrane fusion protein/cobalt-zinc-cadmium efflux system membrane fusion protein